VAIALAFALPPLVTNTFAQSSSSGKVGSSPNFMMVNPGMEKKFASMMLDNTVRTSDYYLEIPGIEGESTDKKHPKTIEIMSWSFGASNPSMNNGGGMPSGIYLSPLFVTKRIDKSTPLLFKAMATGEHIKRAVLYVKKKGAPEATQRYSFFDIFIENVYEMGTGSEELENLSLNYQKVEVAYKVGKDWITANAEGMNNPPYGDQE